MRPLPLALLGLAAAGVLAAGACGGPAAGPPADAAAARGCDGKPAPPIGRIELAVVGRPAPGRAVLEARWTRTPLSGAEAVELVLPPGARVVEGMRRRALSDASDDGAFRWTVAFPHVVGGGAAGALDAVVRLRAGSGHDARARESCVRLRGP